MIGKLGTPDDFGDLLRARGLAPLPFTEEHATTMERFPELVGHDPFDRMLLARAYAERIDSRPPTTRCSRSTTAGSSTPAPDRQGGIARKVRMPARSGSAWSLSVLRGSTQPGELLVDDRRVELGEDRRRLGDLGAHRHRS